MEKSAEILSSIVIWSKYSRFLNKKNRREVWSEIVDRNKAMHLKKYPALKDEIEDAYKLVLEKKVLPSLRSMQFGGRAAEVTNARIFNCSFLPVDSPIAFSEIMYLLLCGCGVGYSVQTQDVASLPPIIPPTKKRRFLVQDSIIGWADAVKSLMKAYFTGGPKPLFDFSDIREKGTPLKTSGGIAPGPEPLQLCLSKIQLLLDRKQVGENLSAIECHDIICHIADAVLAGGIRRSACLALFSFDDEEMLACKFGKWYELNSQRGRANNSAAILRHKITKDAFLSLWDKIEKSGSGEPGFMMTNDKEWGVNPCAEISLRPFQFCNLVSINTTDIITQEELNARARAAAFIATLQAGYTNFHYLRDKWKEVTEKEALIGVSLAGIASGGVLKLDLTEAAEIVTKENARVAKLIGINKAARCTCEKPDGTTSLVLGCSSGVHAWHSPYYIRRMRLSKAEPMYKYLVENHPELVEDDFFKPTTDAIVSVPIKAPDGAISRDESAIDLLSRVSRIYKEWIVPGHRKGSNTNNVSATISIKDTEWKEVGEWMWRNKNDYTALSVLPFDNHSYTQAPFQEISKAKYEEMYKSLQQIDLSKIVEVEDGTKLQQELACAGSSSCEVF